MSDYISRQAAIDEAKEWIDAVYFEENDKRERKAIECFIGSLKNMPSAQQWIPCSERLPSTKDDYIITVKDKSLTWTDYVEWSADYHWWEYDDDMVIAWMPLPEPYKGEES